MRKYRAERRTVIVKKRSYVLVSSPERCPLCFILLIEAPNHNCGTYLPIDNDWGHSDNEGQSTSIEFW